MTRSGDRQQRGDNQRHSVSDLADGSRSKSLANVLDEWFTIPGTRIKIGLDPIIGFAFQAFGDAASAVAGSFILREAIVRGVPRKVLVRMGGNLFLNAALGSLPLVGDAFSIWFKSNARNYALLREYCGLPNASDRKPSTWPIIFIVGLALALIAGVAVGVFFLVRALFS